MTIEPPDERLTFDERYFKSGTYANVSFDRFSQYWWSNRYYALLVRKYGPASGRVLEVGCGLGHLLGWLTDRYSVFGADINPWALRQAHRNIPEVSFLQLSAENLRTFPDESFSVVITKHVVEHLPNPDMAISEMSRILMPDGLLLFSTPNLDSIGRAIKKKNWIGYQDPTHINLRSPQSWLNDLRSYNFSPRKIFSDGFWDVPYVDWLPTSFQRILFGAPGGLQAILGWSIIPLRMGESMIVLAYKNA
jgi:ubiquinone/menaquinone biosynthesis C-methylase UbiE